MDISEIRKEIIASFHDKWELNDRAHREEHFEDVFKCGMKINEHIGGMFDPKLILFAAYFHDMFAWSRNNHHEMSFHWMQTTNHPVILKHLDANETLLVSWACFQHRASFEGEFKNKFAELINSADRGFPGDVPGMINRAVLYRQKNFPHMSEEEWRVDAIDHLKRKYTHGGYARFPDMYLNVFGEELETQRAEIALL